MTYQIRFLFGGESKLWCNVCSDEALLHEIKNCLNKMPTATIHIQLSEDNT